VIQNSHHRIAKTTATRLRPLVVVTAVLLATVNAFAHVELDTHTGDEQLAVGSTTTIKWHDTVAHGPADYDLWYSVTGSDGPWISIAENLTPTTNPYSHEWTVPDAPSDMVRVRVRQDNAGTDYYDVSDMDLSIIKARESQTVELDAFKDATLYEDSGDTANGAGSYLFTGVTESRNGAMERRALLAFPVSESIPAGSKIIAVSLQLTVSRTISGPQSVGLHRVTEGWQEGSSDPIGQEGGGTTAVSGDTTWSHRDYPDTTWSNAGGSFDAAASSTASIDDLGTYTFESTPQLIADVEAWLDDPSDNHGWALVMSQAPTGSAKRFNSRENGTASARPLLKLTYESQEVEAPVAGFSFDPERPTAGSSVSFSDTSSGTPTSWAWTFGDGESSSEQNPTHVFAEAGSYTVELMVGNAAGSDTTSQQIVVGPGGNPELQELVLLPAAANAEGSGGSFFVTTADVFNGGATTASFNLVWLPRDRDNSNPTTSPLFTLEPGRVIRFDNLLEEVFGLEGVAGAVALKSDTNGLEIVSRTFNQTAQGTFGQSIPGILSADLISAGQRARVLFLTENGAFRSNLGFASASDDRITVHWELFAADGSSLATGQKQLPPWGNTQINRVLADHAPIEAAYAEVWTSSTGGVFGCFASVLDESTSDPTTMMPR
jgi:PKD repeat protein